MTATTDVPQPSTAPAGTVWVAGVAEGHPRLWAVGRSVLLIVVPVAASLCSLVAAWRFPVMVSDTAWLSQRVADAASGRFPLVGMPSSIGRGALATHHPGPVQFYWLAPWWAIWGFRGIVLGSAAGSAVGLWALGGLARRVSGGSMWVAVLTQVAVAGSVLSISTEILADAFNPFAALVPAAVTVVGAAAVVRRVEGGWPSLLIAGSITAQLHIGFLPWFAFLVAVVVIGVSTVKPPPDRPWWSPPAEPWQVQAGFVLLALLWIPPLIDQIGGIGNIGLLAEAAFKPGAEAAGWRPALVATGVAIDPWHGTLDGPWIPIALTGGQWWSLALAVGAGAVAVIVAPRGHWCRTWLAVSMCALVAWTALASRALPFEGLLPSPYVRTLWPLGALWWVGAAAGMWARVPEGRWRSPAVPIALTVAWVVTIPTGTIGLDPATRTRGAELVEATAGFRSPAGVNVTARNYLTGWFFAPAVTAEMDRRGIPNGIGNEPDWDVASMSDRPQPLGTTECRLLIADRRSAAPFLNGPTVAQLPDAGRALETSRTQRRNALARSLESRFGRLEPSPLARVAAKEPVDRDWWGGDAAALIRSGRFSDLAANGMIDEVSMRDSDVAEFVELDHLLDPDWSEVGIWSIDC